MTDTVLVTGSSRGIGRAIALRLAEAGYDLVLHCRSGRTEAEAVQAHVHALGRQARVLQFDVADRAELVRRGAGTCVATVIGGRLVYRGR